jgi:hypothetical protein
LLSHASPRQRGLWRPAISSIAGERIQRIVC